MTLDQLPLVSLDSLPKVSVPIDIGSVRDLECTKCGRLVRVFEPFGPEVKEHSFVGGCCLVDVETMDELLEEE